MKRHAPYLAALLIGALVATWPLAAVMGTDAIGHPYGDLADHYWGTWWFGRTLLGGALPLHTDLSHFPERLDLWYIDPVGALLALPLRWLGFPAAWNLLVLGQVTASAWAAYAVGQDLSGRRGGGLVAGVVCGLSPYTLGLVHSGLSEFLTLAPVTLYVGLLLRASGRDPRGRPPPPRAGLWGAVLLALCAAATLYYFLFGLLVAAAMVPGAGWRARLRAVAPVVLGGAALAAPLALLTLSTLGGGGAVSAANAPGWVSRLPATDLQTFVHPGAYYFPDTPALGNPGILQVNYLGAVALAAAAFGLGAGAPRRALALPAALYGVLLLGPRLAWGKHLVTVGGASVLLPYGLLYAPGSPFGFVHQPYRMVAFFLPFLGLAAACGAARAPRWLRPVLAVAVLVETLAASPAPWPLAHRPIAPLAVQPTGPVLDWPPDASTWNRDYLMAATQHGQPVPYGVNVFLNEPLRRDPLVASMLRALGHLERRARNRDVPFQGRVLLPVRSGGTQLAALGFAQVVVHRADLSDAEWAATEPLLDAAFGPASTQTDALAVWNVR